jgi:hypothetical protein
LLQLPLRTQKSALSINLGIWRVGTFSVTGTGLGKNGQNVQKFTQYKPYFELLFLTIVTLQNDLKLGKNSYNIHP